MLEKGFGFDRTLYRLPALLLDDYADLTPEILRQAYIEAIYYADLWDYKRLTKQYWEHLIYDISDNSNIDLLLTNHPMKAEDTNFTRPLVPYDCESMGGCGAGTKRTPKKYCAIDPTVVNKNYKWDWDHSINDRT